MHWLRDRDMIAQYDARAKRHGLTVTDDSSELGMWPWRYMIYPIEQHEPGELTVRHLKSWQVSASLDLLDYVAPD
jgi:hypothetical protein